MFLGGGKRRRDVYPAEFHQSGHGVPGETPGEDPKTYFLSG